VPQRDWLQSTAQKRENPNKELIGRGVEGFFLKRTLKADHPDANKRHSPPWRGIIRAGDEGKPQLPTGSRSDYMEP